MATTIEHVEALLRNDGMKFERVSEDAVGLLYTTTQFRDADGDRSLSIFITVAERGQFLQVEAPMLFTAEGEHRAAILELCLSLHWHWKMVRFQLDTRDNEIRLAIHVPLMDAELSDAALRRVIGCVVQVAEAAYPSFVTAHETGEVLPSTRSLSAELDELRQLLAGFDPAQLDQLRQMSPEQLDRLRAVLNDATAGSAA